MPTLAKDAVPVEASREGLACNNAAVDALALSHALEELAEARQQQAATAEILKAISASREDAQPVFDVIAEHAVRLCAGQFCAVFHFDGELIHIRALHGMSMEGELAYRQGFPLPAGSGSAIGRAIQNRLVEHIPDVQADIHYRQATIAHAVTFRAIVAVPILRDGKPIGGMAVSSSRAEPFSDARVALLGTFADQAAIAIENVRLFKETREALNKQRAISEILKSVSKSSLVVQPVFDSIVRNAVVLCDALFGIVFRLDDGLLHMVAHQNLTPEVLALLSRLYPMRPDAEHASGRVILSGARVHVEDVTADPNYHQGVAAFGGWRSLLAVPMLAPNGAVLGVIWVARAHAGHFPDDQVALLETFSDQATIAIENVRLFKELGARTDALTQAVEQTRALSEVGQAVSSTLDLDTVLATIVSNAVALSKADAGDYLRVRRGGRGVCAAGQPRRQRQLYPHAARIEAADRGVGGRPLRPEPQPLSGY